MARWLAVLLGCLAFALVAAGCGDDEEDSGGGGATTEQAQTDAGTTEKTDTGAAKGNQHGVAMKDIQFEPAEITIKKGDTVKWTNEEDVSHDVTGESGPKKFKSGPSGGMGKGDSFSTNFTAPGTYDYVCTVHANMKGKVTVE